jgi:hypothetical protein
MAPKPTQERRVLGNCSFFRVLSAQDLSHPAVPQNPWEQIFKLEDVKKSHIPKADPLPGSFLIESVPCWDAAVFLQPFQFFPYFDFAVPGIFA